MSYYSASKSFNMGQADQAVKQLCNKGLCAKTWFYDTKAVPSPEAQVEKALVMLSPTGVKERAWLAQRGWLVKKFTKGE